MTSESCWGGIWMLKDRSEANGLHSIYLEVYLYVSHPPPYPAPPVIASMLESRSHRSTVLPRTAFEIFGLY